LSPLLRLQEIYYQHFSDIQLRKGPIEGSSSEMNTESAENDSNTSKSSFFPGGNNYGGKPVSISRYRYKATTLNPTLQDCISHELISIILHVIKTEMKASHTVQENHGSAKLTRNIHRRSPTYPGSRRKAGGAKGIAKARPVASGTVSTSARGKHNTEVSPIVIFVISKHAFYLLSQSSNINQMRTHLQLNHCLFTI
jgi:hypothetical protein